MKGREERAKIGWEHGEREGQRSAKIAEGRGKGEGVTLVTNSEGERVGNCRGVVGIIETGQQQEGKEL